MILISHRGNITGIDSSRENTTDYITEALEKGYDVEIDVRGRDGKFFLGHDFEQEEVDGKYLSGLKFWVHAKNIEAVELIREWNRTNRGRIHWFWHQSDDMTITSIGFAWTYPGKPLVSGAVAVLPETVDNWDIKKAGAICSDYIEKYMTTLL